MKLFFKSHKARWVKISCYFFKGPSAKRMGSCEMCTITLWHPAVNHLDLARNKLSIFAPWHADNFCADCNLLNMQHVKTFILLPLLSFRVIRLTRLPTVIVERSEHLQVVRYDQGGYYHAHWDSSPFHPDRGCVHTAVFGGGPFPSTCR